MSFQDHPFRMIPFLQHMAKVKIIETQWRNYEDKEEIKNILTQPCYDYLEFSSSSYYLSTPFIEKIKIELDSLPAPKDIKILLKTSLVPMVLRAFEWLSSTAGDTPDLKKLDEDWAEAICHFIDNLCFDNFGCVDGRKILESYVSDKEIVGYWVWDQLCFYCIEEKIVEFSKKFDWKECTNGLDSHYAVYWYRKINGELPTEKMSGQWAWQWYYYGMDDGFTMADGVRTEGGFSNVENIEQNMLTRTMGFYNEYRSTPAIIHFQNQLNNDEEFNKLVTDSLTKVHSGDVMIYLLRTMTKDALLKSIATDAEQILRPWAKWPWIFLMDDWIHMFGTDISADFFTEFFDGMGYLIKQVEGDYKVALYEVFERIFRIFHERFTSHCELIAEAFWTVFVHNDVNMCSFMLQGMESHKRLFIVDLLTNYIDIHYSLYHSYSFHHLHTKVSSYNFRETAELVFSEEERKRFWEIYDKNKDYWENRNIQDDDWDVHYYHNYNYSHLDNPFHCGRERATNVRFRP